MVNTDVDDDGDDLLIYEGRARSILSGVVVLPNFRIGLCVQPVDNEMSKQITEKSKNNRKEIQNFRENSSKNPIFRFFVDLSMFFL